MMYSVSTVHFWEHDSVQAGTVGTFVKFTVLLTGEMI